MEGLGNQQWNRGPTHKMAAMPEEGDDISRILRKTIELEIEK
jgi:hypothetical protein